MAPRRYLNFDLLLQGAGGEYQALVTASPFGETHGERFALPFDDVTLENLLLKLDPGRSGTRRTGGTPSEQAGMDFGGPLYTTVFRDDVMLAWTRSLDRAREEGVGLRLRLRFADAPVLAGLPWELLYDARSNNFVAQSERTPLVRYLDVPHVPRPITVDGPLRVLAIISSPTDLPPLDVEGEWGRLQEAMSEQVAAGLVVLDRLPRPTMAELRTWLRNHDTNVIHFVGHGEFEGRQRQGVIYFEDRRNHASAITSSVLGPPVRDHDQLRMIVLNACRTARSDAIDPFSGLAQGLVQQDVTAVVAMQFPISDEAAMVFSTDFYGAMVDGLPVDQAVSSARQALTPEYGDEWATPVLFLRAPDGAIFENVVADKRRIDPSWFARHARLLAGAGAAVLLAVVTTVIVTDDDDTVGPGPDQQGAVTALSDSQLLVVAGDSRDLMQIYVVDTVGGAEPVLLNDDVIREGGPSIGPDRDIVAYPRATSGTSYQLRAVVPGQGEDEPLLASVPDQCVGSIGRPAWLPSGGPQQIVAPCKDSAGGTHLVLLDMDGEVQVDYVERIRGLGHDIRHAGDPTVSEDGQTVVFWASTDDRADYGGHLWRVQVDGSDPQMILEASEFPGQYSDAIFFDEGRSLAYRKNVGGENGFDIYTLEVDDPVGTEAELVGSPAKEEDPAVSPEETQVAYKRSETFTSTESRIYVVSLSGDGEGEPLLPEDFSDVQSVPSWSRR